MTLRPAGPSARRWPPGDGEMVRLIREHDWASTPLGPVEAWPASLRAAVELLVPHGFPMVVLWGPELIQLYNDRYCFLMGDKHPAGLGQPTRECWPEVWHINEPIYERVRGGETLTFEDALYPVARHGPLEDAWFTLTYSPLRERDDVAGVLVTVFETTERVRTERGRNEIEDALRESEERSRALATAGAFLVYRMSPDWRIMYQLSGRDFLADTPEPVESWADSYLLPEDRPEIDAAIAEAMRTKSTFELEHRVRTADGGVGWVHSRAVPIVGPDGETVEWFGTGSDITVRKEAEASLRESEALRRIALAGGGMGTWRWDLRTRLIRGDTTFLALWGFPPSDRPLPLSLFTARMSPEGAAEMEVVVARAITAGDEFDGPLEIISGPTAGRWIRWRGRADGAIPTILYGVTFDITERKRAENALRESEERLAFLLKLSDALRPLTDVGAMERVATRLLGEHLQADRCFLSPVHDDGTGTCVREGYLRSGASSVLGDYTFAQFGEFVGPELHAGRILAVEDVDALAGLSPDERASYAAVGIGAYLLIPLVRDGRLAAFLTINHRTPRRWSDADRAVARQTADRLWAARERGRTEAALRASEERFRSFAEHSADTLWIVDFDPHALVYLSPAYERMFGEALEPVMKDLGRWAEIVHPEDRDRAGDGLSHLLGGEPYQQEYRIVRPRDGAVRWIQDTGFPIRDERGRITRAGGIAQDVTDARVATEHQAMLLAELQHRVRNTLAVIRSIARRTAATSETVEDYALELDGRLNAFARVQSAVTRNPTAGIDLGYLIGDELNVHRARDGRQVRIEGPAIRLRPKAAETLGLAFHELATNAVKHGALATPRGRITIAWHREGTDGDARLVLTWKESGVRPATLKPERRGFGTDLLLRTLAYELKAEAEHVIEPDGLRYTLLLPLSSKVALGGGGLSASASG